MVGKHVAIGGAVLGLLVAWTHPAVAQSDAERQALRAEIEQRFTPLPIQGGVLLTPRRPNRDVRSIQVTGGDIALDGELVTGAELRKRLGADADVIRRLSYLDATDQRALFGQTSGALPAEPVVPDRSFGPRFPRPPRPPRPPRQPGGNDRVRIGGGVQVAPGEVVRGDVVAIGGDASIDGQVTGDVVCVAGNTELGPNADIGGDLTVVAGTLKRDPAARVGGSVNEVGWGDFHFLPNRVRRPELPGIGSFLSGPNRPSLFTLISTIVRLTILCFLASLVFLFGREYVQRVGDRAAAEPLKAGLVGLLIQLLFIPALVVTVLLMIVTIIGIPLLALIPFALVALAVFWLVGFSAVAHDVGRFSAARIGWQEQSPYLVTALGVAVLLSPVLIGGLIGLGGGLLVPLTWALLLLGFFVEYAAWTVGLGAIALLRFGR
jgi:hypothetical protein